MSISLSFSEKLNLQIQYSIFNHLDKVAEKTQWIRLPASFALGVSSLTYLTTQITSVVELTLHGLILSSASSSEERTRGQTLLKRVPGQVKSLCINLPVELLTNTVVIISKPNFFVQYFIGCAKISSKHLEKNTIGSQDYHDELLRNRETAFQVLLA